MYQQIITESRLFVSVNMNFQNIQNVFNIRIHFDILKYLLEEMIIYL